MKFLPQKKDFWRKHKAWLRTLPHTGFIGIRKYFLKRPRPYKGPGWRQRFEAALNWEFSRIRKENHDLR